MKTLRTSERAKKHAESYLKLSLGIVEIVPLMPKSLIKSKRKKAAKTTWAELVVLEKSLHIDRGSKSILERQFSNSLVASFLIKYKIVCQISSFIFLRALLLPFYVKKLVLGEHYVFIEELLGMETFFKIHFTFGFRRRNSTSRISPRNI